VSRIYRDRNDWRINTLEYGSLRFAGNDTIVRDNPDTIVSFAVLDISTSPVRIHCAVPEGDNYWSVSIFAWNTDTFYIVNDLEAPAPEFDVMLVKRNSLYQPLPRERIVVSPTERAVLIVRMNVTDRHDEHEVARLTEVQHRMFVEPVDGVIY
jgi:uncharacterized membrane protein